MEPKTKIITPIQGTNPPNVTPILPTVPPIIPVTTEITIGTEKFNLNDKGEAIDATGKILKTKEEIELLKNPPVILTEEQKIAAAKLAEKATTIEKLLVEGAEVELDGVKYNLTKEGTILKDGKVLKSKDEIKAMLLAAESETESEDINYISEVQKATNLIITGENNQPITYENNIPGLVQYAQDVYKEGKKLGAEEYKNTIFSKFPILESVVQHLTLNGSLEGFSENIDYSKITITDDESQQIELYTRAKTAQGMSVSEITDMVKYLKEDKKLKDAANTGLTYLKTVQEANSATRASQIKALEEAESAKETEYWNNVDTALNAKQLTIGDKKFNIPEIIKIKDGDGKIVSKTVKDFENYIKKPLQFKIDGKIYTMTQHDFDEYNEDIKRTPHNDLFDAYRRFTKYDDAQLITANISSGIVKQVIKLKSKAGSGGSGTAGSGGKIVLPIK